jgi:predicted nucleic-acid-binding Zn-ribbon protein
MVNCPKCTKYDKSETVSGRLNHHIVKMQEQKFYDLKGFITFVCPECGYSELYKESLFKGKVNIPVVWWEMLDWNEMENTWDKLSGEIKNKIRKAGLAPKYDFVSQDKETSK